MLRDVNGSMIQHILLFFKQVKAVRLLTLRNMNRSLFRSNSISWFFCKASGLWAKVIKICMLWAYPELQANLDVPGKI